MERSFKPERLWRGQTVEVRCRGTPHAGTTGSPPKCQIADVSMHKWQDNIAGRRLDTPEDTGDGTLNLKNISKAFELSYYKINNYLKIEDDLKKITSNNEPYFIEVMTDNKQKIFNAIVDN